MLENHVAEGAVEVAAEAESDDVVDHLGAPLRFRERSFRKGFYRRDLYREIFLCRTQSLSDAVDYLNLMIQSLLAVFVKSLAIHPRE